MLPNYSDFSGQNGEVHRLRECGGFVGKQGDPDGWSEDGGGLQQWVGGIGHGRVRQTEGSVSERKILVHYQNYFESYTSLKF